MKIAGKRLCALNEEIVVLPREGIDPETGEPISDIVFRFKPLSNMEHFEQVCPEPKPTSYITLPGEKVGKPDFSDPAYQKAVAERNRKLPLYMLIASISATPGLEFETVDINKPETWENVSKEFAEAGLTNAEVGRLYSAALSVNSLDDAAIEAAKQRFLAGERLRVVQASSRQAVAPST